MSYDNDWLNLLNEFTDPLTGTASLIKTSIPGMGLVNSRDEDFFLYWFMDRAVNIGKSVALLVEHGLDHEAGVAARTAVEAQIYLAEYKRDKSLARKWRYFSIYEDYHEIYRDAERAEFIKQHEIQRAQNIDDKATAKANAKIAAKAAAEKRLVHWRKLVGEKTVKEVQALFQPFERPGQSWYGGRLKELIDKLREDPGNIPGKLPPELEESLRWIVGFDPVADLFFKYHRFSLVVHWNPSVVVGLEGRSDFANAALATAFEYLYAISTYVNDQRNFGYDNALDDIKDRYNQKAAKLALDLKQQRK